MHHRIITPCALAAALVGLSAAAYGHGGGLDRHGCHNNRKTGGYHCHRSTTRSTTSTQSLFSAPKRTTTPTPIVAPPSFSTSTATKPQTASSQELTKTAQRLLIGLKLYDGPVNGVLDLETRAGIEAFEASLGRKETGEITEELVMELADSVVSLVQWCGR